MSKELPRVLEHEPPDDHTPNSLDAVTGLFEAWAADRGRLVSPGVVRSALAHRLARIGDLRRWSADDVAQLYHEWQHRSMRAERPTLALLGPTMLDFVDFLADLGWLDHSTAPHRKFRALVTTLSIRLVDALTDCGQSDLLVQRLRVARVDLGERGAQERLFAVMARHLVEHFPPSPVEPTLLSMFEPQQIAFRTTRWMHRPVRLPAEETLEQAAAGTPAMRRLRRFTRWAGTPRRLTARGNLRVADGIDAAHVLEVGDADLARFGVSGRVPSSTRLGQTHFTFRWAVAAGLVCADDGVLTPTLLSPVLLDRPLQLAARAVSALCTTNLCTADRRVRHRAGDHGTPWPVDPPPDLLRTLLEALYGSAGPVDFTTFAERVGGFPGPFDESVVQHSRDDLSRLVLELEELGVLSSVGGDVEQVRDGSRRRHGGLLALTPLGIWCVHRLLRADGLPAPLSGELSDFDATTLLEMCAGYDDAAIAEEAARWRAARGRRAAPELAEAIRNGHPGSRMSAFAAISGLGEDAEPTARSLLDEPRIRPFALVWLIEHGLAEPDVLAPDDMAHMLVEAMVAFLNDDPDKAVYVFARDRTAEDQIHDIAHVWRLDNPYAVPLLEAIAERHPDEQVAHAAKVALQTR